MVRSPLLALCLMAMPAQSQMPPQKAQVDQIFSSFTAQTPGCAVGVAHQGSVVLKAGYGMADLERHVAITADSVFESGSVAKQFTAATLMLLAQQGKISLDDPMRKYLPELPDYGAPLTIWQVMHHLSGLREWRPIAEFSGAPEGTRVYTNHDLLQFASKQRALNFDPGTYYSYSNTGFNIATILVERVLGGKTFQAFTKEAIFEPLGMTHTRWRDNFRTIVANRALAYTRGSDGWIQATPIENIIGAGGMLTTVGDLLLWNENFTHAKVGGAEFVKAQQVPAKLASGRAITYAAGLTVKTVDGLREVAHAGATGGYRTWLARYPEKNVSVAVMCNSAQANPTLLGRSTARLWTGASASEPVSSYSADASKLEALAGMYRSVRNSTIAHLHWRDGKLVMTPGAEWKPVAVGRFSMGGLSEIRIEDGGPLKFRLSNDDADFVFERVEPVQPGATDLAVYIGDYYSDETGGTLKIAAEADGLTYTIGTVPRVKLRPTFQDAFITDGGSSVRFVRDSSGKVTGLSVGDDRVWDLRFSRKR